MKNPILLLSLFLLQAGQLFPQFHETRAIEPFHSIECYGSVQVYYTQADTSSMKVYAAEEELARVETRFSDGKLVISNKSGKYSEPVKVYIRYKGIHAISCSGASSFKSLNSVTTDSLDLSLSGSAQMKLQTETRSIRSIQSGASHLKLAGSTSNLYSELSGASSLSSYELSGKYVKVSATGASSAKVYSDGRVVAIAGGASNIKIKGDVKDISAEASPSSSITRIVDKDKQASSGTADGDSTVYNWKGKKIIIIEKDDDQEKHSNHYNTEDEYFDGYRHWAGLSFGVNGFLDPSFSTNYQAPDDYMNLNYAKSFNYQFNLFEGQIKLAGQRLVLVTGFGFDYHSYELEKKVSLNADSDYTSGTIDSSNQFNYVKNRLRNTYIQAPLLLEFNSNKRSAKCFHMAAGVIGQFQIASRTRQVLEREAYEYEVVRKDSYNTNPFMLKAHLNMGYHRWTFYGEYCLTPLFQKNKGPELYPFAVGLRVVPFG